MADGPFFNSLCYSVQSLRPQIYIFFFNCLLIITEKKKVLSLRKFGLLGLLGWQRSCLLSWSRMRASVKRNCEGGNRKCNWARISPACEITRLIDPFALLLRVEKYSHIHAFSFKTTEVQHHYLWRVLDISYWFLYIEEVMMKLKVILKSIRRVKTKNRHNI